MSKNLYTNREKDGTVKNVTDQISWMTQVWARRESRIRIAFDHSLELQSLASSILSVTFDAIAGGSSGSEAAQLMRLIFYFFFLSVVLWASELLNFWSCGCKTVFLFFLFFGGCVLRCGGREGRGRKEKKKNLKEEMERKEEA